MGRRRQRGRSVHGVLLLDKPVGLTSNQALQAVKLRFLAAKAGHTGSLDPLASGMLPICLGEATKLSGFLLNAGKVYWTRCRLGVRTNTGDADGETLDIHDVPSFDLAVVDAVLDDFRGEIEQIPPMFSALKQQGRRLYDLAREGIEVDRPARRIMISELRIELLGAEQLELRVHCSKGTYIRSLVEDIGQKLGCGAHVEALRRLRVGPYQAEDMVTVGRLDELAEQGQSALDGALLPLDSVIDVWPEVHLSADLAFYVRQGQPVLVPRAPTAGMVRLYERDGAFMGVGEVIDDGRVAPRRIFRI